MNLQAFYQVRGNLYKFFKKYETIIQAVIKFVGFLVIFRIISGSDMFEGGGPLNSFWLQLVLAAVATVLPNRCGVLIAILLGGYNIITASLIGGILLLVLMLVLYIITVRFTPEYAYFMLVIPLCIHTKFYLLVPLLAGMYIGTISIIPIVTGTLMWGIVRMIPAFLAIQSGELELSQLPQILTSASTYGYEQLLKNNELIFVAATLVVVMLTVNLLQKLQKDYIQYIALGAGGVLGLICLLTCKIAVGLSAGYFLVILCSLVAVVIAAVVQFMWIPLDYKAAQNLSFSDDEYFYQVRVVPKINIGKEKKEVKKITESRRETLTEPDTATKINWQRVTEAGAKENTAKENSSWQEKASRTESTNGNMESFFSQDDTE